MTVIVVICLIFIAFVGIGIFFGGAPWLPTRRPWVEQALDLAKVGKNDVVVDLGSGDGVVLGLACRRGAKQAIGYEINPLLVVLSRLQLRRYGKRVLVRDCDLFRTDLPADTTVIYLFGVGRMMNRLADYLAEQRPGIRTRRVKVISFGFEIPGLKLVDSQNGFNLYYL